MPSVKPVLPHPIHLPIDVPLKEAKHKDGAGKAVSPYTVLAAGYDVVMEHVEYDTWAIHVDRLLTLHHPSAQTILELGCGTGSFALEMQPRGPYRYAGTDISEQMIAVARAKAELEDAPIQFEVADFTNFRVDRPVDVVLLLYDGLNYLLEVDEVAELFRCAFAAVAPGGLFVVDQSTPENSVRNERFFFDEGEAEGFSYVRRSAYDPEAQLHTTTLEMTVLGKHFTEHHVQRAYGIDDIRPVIEATGFVVEAVYDGFSTLPANVASERLHWVLRRPHEHDGAGG